ncbi:hypothetical protein C8R42DRAFT_196944 [Lentinula raphanica]|nr:hypothetical protein C8R42DRAFT_196944 [Lentinula raphanica]
MLARILLRMTVTCFCTQGLISSLSPRVLASPLALHQSSSRTDTVSSGSVSESLSELLSTSTHALETRDYHRPLDFIYELPRPATTFSKMQRRPYDNVRDRAKLKDFGFRFLDFEKCMEMLGRRDLGSLPNGMHPIRHGIRTLGKTGLVTSSSDSLEDLIKWLLSTVKEEGDCQSHLADVSVGFLSEGPYLAIIFNDPWRTGFWLDKKSPRSVDSRFYGWNGEVEDFEFRTKFVAGCMSMIPGESVQKSFERLLDAGLLTASNRRDSLKKLRLWLGEAAETTSASGVERS